MPVKYRISGHRDIAMINVDITSVIQFVNFLITLIVLNYLLITPIRKIIVQRKEAMDKMQDAVNLARKASESKFEKYNQSLADYRTEAVKTREEIRNTAIARERELTNAALAEAQGKMQVARADISAQVERAMSELRQSVPSMTKEAVSRILA